MRISHACYRTTCIYPTFIFENDTTTKRLLDKRNKTFAKSKPHHLHYLLPPQLFHTIFHIIKLINYSREEKTNNELQCHMGIRRLGITALQVETSQTDLYF